MVTPIHYSPPKDPYNVVFILFYFMSIGTLLPWNFFITVSGYWMYKFRTVDNVTDSEIDCETRRYNVTSDGKNDLQIRFASDLAIAAQIPNVTVLILNGLFGHRFKTTPRLLVSLVMVVLLFIATLSLVKVNTDSWQQEFLYLTLACVVAINIFGATFQGGLLGLVGTFPPAYINAVLNGLAVGGTFAATVNIVLLAVGGDDISAAFYCFLIACVFLSGSVVAFFMVSRTHFYKFYMNEQVEPAADERTPLVQDSSSQPDIHIVDVLYRIHVQGITVFIIYIVTLGCFPGLTVLIESTSRGDPGTTPWENDYFIPVTCFLFYNIGDYLGRMMSCSPALPTPGPRLVLLLSLLRLAFLPIFLLCNAAPLRRAMTPIVFHSDGLYIAFMFIFSASNGYLTNICMVAAPQSVPPHLQQTASNLMVGILGLGLVVGSAISAVLVQFL